MRVQSGVKHVSSHERFDAVTAGLGEGREFDGAQLVQRSRDGWKIEVRVFLGVAVAGKMFSARNNACVSSALDPWFAKLDDLLRVGSEGAVTNDGITGIRVYI